MVSDQAVRLAAFRFLEEQTSSHGEVIPREILAQGFSFAGSQVRLIGPQGIFKPAALNVPISITTVPPTGAPPPYEDGFGSDGLMRYKYRGTDAFHPDNVGLRAARDRHMPLIYNYGIVPGRYLPTRSQTRAWRRFTTTPSWR